MNRAAQCYRAFHCRRTGQPPDGPLCLLARWTILAAGLSFAACASATVCAPLTVASQTVVTDWNCAALTEITPVASTIGPPPSARALAIAHTCMYDAWSVYDATAAPTLGAPARRPAVERTDANKAKAISYAAYNCLMNLFSHAPGDAPAVRLAAVMTAHGYDPNDTSTDPTTPQGIGNVAAARVIRFRRDDGSNQYGRLGTSGVPYSDYTGYTPRNAPLPYCNPQTAASCPVPLNIADPLHWQPLINSAGVTQHFITPQWDHVTPFALTSATEFDNQIPPPDIQADPTVPPAQNSHYQANVVFTVQNSEALDLQRKLIVEYWADGPNSVLPPGHWGFFAQFVSARDHHSIDDDTKMFFAMHNASFDASIVCWHAKRMYDGVRPITAARYLAQGTTVTAWGGYGAGGAGTPPGTGPGAPPVGAANAIYLAQGWIPYNPGSNLSPGFPAYFSGHSVFSRTSATVLQLFTGSDLFGYSQVLPTNFGRVEPCPPYFCPTGIPAVPTTFTYPTFSSAAAEAGQSRLYGGIHFSDDNTTGQTVGALIGQQAWAQSQLYFAGLIAIDNTSNATSNNAATLSWSHTVGTPNNRLLLVGISGGNGSSVRGVTYAGQPLTQRLVQNGPGNRIELWYLLAPPSGTANVVATLANAAPVVGGAASFTAVNQSRPFGESASGSGQTSTASVNIADTTGDQVVFSMVAANEGANPVVVTGAETAAWNNGSGTASTDILGAAATGPGNESTVPVSYVLATSQPWALGAVALRPALTRMGLPH